MRDIEFDYIKNKFSGYSRKEQNFAFNFLLDLISNFGITPEEYIEYYDLLALKKRSKQEDKNEIVKKCPECKKDMFLFTVNDKPRAMVGGKYKTQWYCQHCFHDELSKLTVEEQIRKTKKSRR